MCLYSLVMISDDNDKNRNIADSQKDEYHLVTNKSRNVIQTAKTNREMTKTEYQKKAEISDPLSPL